MNKATLTPDILKDLKTIHALRDEQFENDEEIFLLSLENEKPQSEIGLLQWRKPKKDIRDYCQEQVVSKGMIADFAIHDKGSGNPHAHIILNKIAVTAFNSCGNLSVCTFAGSLL